MDGPPEDNRNRSDSSDLSLPPQPETRSWSSISDHSEDKDPAPPERSPPKRPPGGRTASPPPRGASETSRSEDNPSTPRQYGAPFYKENQESRTSQGTKAQAARLTPMSEVPQVAESAATSGTNKPEQAIVTVHQPQVNQPAPQCPQPDQ